MLVVEGGWVKLDSRRHMPLVFVLCAGSIHSGLVASFCGITVSWG